MSEKKIIENSKDVFTTASFAECHCAILRRILEFERLSCSEVDVFNVCMAWLKAKSIANLVTKAMVRVYLGCLFYEIPFGTFNYEEFTAILPTYGHLFTAPEYQEILRMIGSKEFETTMFKRGVRQI